ncbi:MAG TPA: arylamine N-acetyltransferase [Pyrinomonadaceae bacterium]|nr:arylamine N-acetyltransferase [Pyrinomonadaceae bacterium]
MNTSEYLARFGVDDTAVMADLAMLRHLQRSHLVNVPFENLDIHWGIPIKPDRESFFAKILANRRGGFCYELNGLFEWLLQQIGFRTRLVSARVFNGTEHGPEFDHAAIIVTLEDDEYLVDVGFGAFTATPLRFAIDVEQADEAGTFLIRKRESDGYFEVMKREEGVWRSEYIFLDTARELSEFAEMCDFQQYAPESHFRKGKLCSIMTASGRKTLTDKSFIITENGEKKETLVNSDAEFYALLSSEFGIEHAHN